MSGNVGRAKPGADTATETMGSYNLYNDTCIQDDHQALAADTAAAFDSSAQPGISSAATTQGAGNFTSGQGLEQQIPEHDVSVLEQAAAAGDIPALQKLLAELGSSAHGVDHRGWTALHAAAEHGQEQAVGLLLAAGADVHAVAYHPDAGCYSSQEQTPLHLAAFGHHAAVVQQLLAAGADVDAADIDGCTALHVAAKSGDSHLVQLLLSAAATVDAVNAGRETPLHTAADQGYQAIVQQLLAAGARAGGPTLLEYRSGSEKPHATPLHYAALRGHCGIVKDLLAAGAQSDAETSPAVMPYLQHHQRAALKTPKGTPLQFAAQNGNQEMLQLMLSGNAAKAAHCRSVDVLSEALVAAIDHGNMSCASLLIAAGALAGEKAQQAAMLAAVRAKNGIAVKQLVGAGVSPDIEVAGQPALHLVLSHEYGDVCVLQQLLAAGAKVTDCENVPTVYHAVTVGNPRLVRVLLAAAYAEGGPAAVKEAVQKPTKSGQCAVHYAAADGNAAMVRLLLRAGADPEAGTDHYKTTALMHACFRGVSCQRHVPVIRQLVAAGAQLDAADKWGNTCLHYAIRYQNLDAARVLLRAGAPQAANEKLETPLHAAVTAVGRNTAAVQMLLSAGAAAVINAGDCHGRTPLNLAVEKGDLGLAEVLLDAGADADVANAEGRTPLHTACMKGSVRFARLLLDKGHAVVTVTDITGNTPLHLAATRYFCEQSCVELVQLLLAHAAVPQAVNHSQQTALHVAILRGNVQAVKTLLSWAPLCIEDLMAAVTLSASNTTCFCKTEQITMMLLRQLYAADARSAEAWVLGTQCEAPKRLIVALLQEMHASSSTCSRGQGAGTAAACAAGADHTACSPAGRKAKSGPTPAARAVPVRPT